MNGVSKKLTMTMIGIQAIVHLSQGAEDKFTYACLVASVVIVYKIMQTIIDKSNKEQNDDRTGNEKD